MSNTLSAATFMNILARRINICQEAFMDVSSPGTAGSEAVLGARAEPVQALPVQHRNRTGQQSHGLPPEQPLVPRQPSRHAR